MPETRKGDKVHLTLPFTLEGEDDETATYVEQVEGDRSSVVGGISVRKSVLPQPLPVFMRVTLILREETQILPEPPGSTLARSLASGERPLAPGDDVTIVKNRLGKVGSPSEWLEQFLGKTGSVLWTSELGAMVDLPDGATWFPFAELKRENPGTL
jgi:hypothetical protein